MKINAILVDTKTDGALPIECDMTLNGINVVFGFEDLESEIMIPVENILTVIMDDLHG